MRRTRADAGARTGAWLHWSGQLAGADTISTDPYAARRVHNEGHGRRLTAAFDALEVFPMMVESRNRVLALFEAGEPATGAVIGAVESDVALTAAVLRLANRVEGPSHGQVADVVKAVEILSARTVWTIASEAVTFDFFERTAVWQGIPERFRLHAMTAQRAADRLAREIRYDARDRLLVTALLHDIGKLVLVHAYPGYPREVHGDARTPEERLQRERRELGVDHAVVGGVLARRWGLPGSIAGVIERHHAEDCLGEAALVRLADILAHYVLGGSANPNELIKVARAVGVNSVQLRTVMYDLPLSATGNRPRRIDSSQLSDREIEVLRELAQGKVYKQIAAELGLATATVRSHLHNIYGKLGAIDRAQAVLIATDRGWI